MFSSAFPIRAFLRRRSRYARSGKLAASLLAVALIASMPVCAQKPMADISSATYPQIKHSPANLALQEGRVDDAAMILRAEIDADAKDSAAHLLLCRVYYAQSQADEAIHECELAVASPSANNEQASDNQLWLGRAYGLKARHAGPFAGYKLARKVQGSFARAVELNPSNVSALNDLGEYDVSAPFIVGGGTDKAQALADRMMPRFPGPAYLLLARIAQSNDDLKTAEAEFRQEIAVERSPEAWIDLAQFYQTHKRPDDALAAVKSALAADRTHGPALVDAASILTAAHRDSDLAERCLRDYLSSHAKSDAAPAFKVHLQLAKLLAARGNTKEADREEEAAAALAPGFTHRTKAAQGI
jgi:tetratricopeptide (TPR) repeat protein